MYLNESLFLDFLNEKEITWTGIDFSKAKFSRKGFDLPQEAIVLYFKEWNMLIISDQKKYDIRMAFRKPVLHYDLQAVTKKNNNIKLNNLLVERLKLEDQLSKEIIKEYVTKSELPKLSKFALSLIVESFDQDSKTASLWVVLQETASGEMVLCEKFLKTPAGFGIRNFWARTFYNLLFDIRKNSFVRWINLVTPNHLIK